MKALGLCLVAALIIGSIRAEPTAEQVTAAKEIANELGRGEFESVWSSFDPNLKASLSAEQIEHAWNNLIAQTGEYDHVAKTQTSSLNGFDVVEVWCATHQAGILVRIVFHPGTQRLGGLWVFPAASPPSSHESPQATPSFP